MKQIELELKKRLLIVEGDFMVYHNGRPLKFICKGSELTEEIAKGLAKQEQVFDTPKVFFFKNYKTPFSHCMNALESFISAIEAQGYYWGKNPIPVPSRTVYQDANFDVDEMEKWNISESKTFNPDKTLIFEIL